MTTTMDLKPSGYPHIVLDERGRTWIDDTGVKVTEVVHDILGVNRYAPHQVQEHFPRLSLVQIYVAMSYYYDHQELVDAEIAQADERYSHLRAATENPELQARLRTAKERWQVGQ